jgi:hypothetical protein
LKSQLLLEIKIELANNNPLLDQKAW